MNRKFYFSTFWFLNPCIPNMGLTVSYVWLSFKAYATFWSILSQPSRMLSLSWAVIAFFNGSFYCPIILSGLLQGDGKHGKNQVVHDHGPIVILMSYLSVCEVSSLARNNTVWNTIMMDKAFWKTTDGSFSKSIMCWKGKSINKISIYSSINKVLCCPWINSIR